MSRMTYLISLYIIIAVLIYPQHYDLKLKLKLISVINAVIVVVVMFSNCESIFSGVIAIATGRPAWSMSWEPYHHLTSAV